MLFDSHAVLNIKTFLCKNEDLWLFKKNQVLWQSWARILLCQQGVGAEASVSSLEGRLSSVHCRPPALYHSLPIHQVQRSERP